MLAKLCCFFVRFFYSLAQAAGALSEGALRGGALCEGSSAFAIEAASSRGGACRAIPSSSLAFFFLCICWLALPKVMPGLGRERLRARGQHSLLGLCSGEWQGAKLANARSGSKQRAEGEACRLPRLSGSMVRAALKWSRSEMPAAARARCDATLALALGLAVRQLPLKLSRLMWGRPLRA